MKHRWVICSVAGTLLVAVLGIASPSLAASHTAPIPRPLWSISCPTSKFCLAADEDGNVLYDSNGKWSTERYLTGIPTVVGCYSTTFCAAISENNGAYTYDGSKWSAGVALTSGVTPTGVSCPSPTECVVVDNYGGYYVYDGSSWTSRAEWDPSANEYGGSEDVSCVGKKFCEAVDQEGNAGTFNGSSWSLQSGIDPHEVGSVSCPTTTDCMAVDRDGDVLKFNGTSWTSPVAVDSGGTEPFEISCASTTFCTVVDASGHAVTYKSSAWGSVKSPDQHGDGFVSVSCEPSTTTCVAVDAAGNALTNKDGTWGSPAAIDTTPYPSTTSVKHLPAKPTYGKGEITLRTHVTSTYGGYISGRVTFSDATTKLCSVTLSEQYVTGKCSVPTTDLSGGSQTITGRYGGDGHYAPSTGTETLEVNKDRTVTALTVSTSTVRYGNEQRETLSVDVTPTYAATLSGTVEVKAGTTLICSATLVAGSGTCSPTAKELKKGTYALVATYGETADFASSKSSPDSLTVSG